MHYLVHTGERNYACNLCDKRFTRLNHLQAHQSVHQTEKQFTCEWCGKSYMRRYNLDMHMRTHHKEKVVLSERCLNYRKKILEQQQAEQSNENE